MSFNIGDEVRVRLTDESGVITDKMFSEAKGVYVYVIKPHDGGRSIMRDGDALEEYSKREEYEIDVDIADNVVIAIIYEIIGERKIEVCRGHGHIIHEGAEGIAQALAYASKKAFSLVDTGIYMKQRRAK